MSGFRVPNDVNVTYTDKGSTVKVHFDIGKIGKEIATRLPEAQKVLDTEVMRGTDPYVPLQTGMLKGSVTRGTIVGSGEIKWVMPYAKRRYYNPRTGSNGEPLRGGYWFERWKNAHGEDAILKVKRILWR